ncbi:tripartite tricarboxylate transporter substrate binding protein [Hydrogenophaga sp. 2FB]|uniref:Bug family tripartite tricarboxylate transporter substrate binding protein n=1 Tax=Hydrogenophaga sp. 2FB TaxID=2502187 RepID=UPI0010F43B1E|nr:tripartite tricarboxylate transporter substrate binding protein [Hydrogenophaga sp. 2FB]
MTHPTRRTAIAALVAVPWLGRTAMAQSDWPRRPIRIVVPYPAGGTPDVTTRVLGEQLATVLKTSVIVEAKPGASGLIGMRAVTSSAADGYTLAYVSTGQVTLSAMNPKFDLLKELKPVVRVSGSPFGVLVSTASPYKTMAELVVAVRAQPGKLSFGTAGAGSPAHMAVAHLEDALKDFQALHVPFKGAVESINAILAGQIDFTIGVLGAAVPHLKAGKLRILAVTPARRVALMPDVPTVAEALGTPYDFQSWGGYMVPAGTPDDVVDRLAAGIAQAANTEVFRKFLQSVAGELDLVTSPAEFRKRLVPALDAERRIVQRLGLKEGS